jgi:hypothetical protein
MLLTYGSFGVSCNDDVVELKVCYSSELMGLLEYHLMMMSLSYCC